MLSYQPSEVKFVKGDEKDVKSKKSISLENFLANKNETLPKVILFTDKANTTPLYKALSVDFKDRMSAGEVKHTEKSILSEYDVQSFPTLLVVSPKDGIVKFDGKLKRDSLKSFLEKYALPPIDKNKKYAEQEKANKKAAPKPAVKKGTKTQQ